MKKLREMSLTENNKQELGRRRKTDSGACGVEETKDSRIGEGAK